MRMTRKLELNSSRAREFREPLSDARAAVTLSRRSLQGHSMIPAIWNCHVFSKSCSKAGRGQRASPFYQGDKFTGVPRIYLGLIGQKWFHVFP